MGIDWNSKDVVHARQMNSLPSKLTPQTDEEVSKIVGHKVLVRDPRLVTLVTKWKQAKGESEVPDNFLQNSTFIKELKEIFTKPL